MTAAVTILELAGGAGNAAFSVPSPAEQREDWQIAADRLNSKGGTACRKLVLKFYSVNILDSSQAQQTCLQIAADHPFMVLDTVALSVAMASDCIPAQKIPLLTGTPTNAQIKKYTPYLIGTGDTVEATQRNGVLALKQTGFFSAANGFKKLGVLYSSCNQGLVDVEFKALADVGIPSNQIVKYSLGCPAGGYSDPATLQQAALAFNRAGVTHQTQVQLGPNLTNFTKTAQQQGYRPKWGFGDGSVEQLTGSSSGADRDNLDGAVNMSVASTAEAATPGFRPSPETAACDAAFKAKGKKPTYQQGIGYGGIACGFVQFAGALLDRTPKLQGSLLASGMGALGQITYPFPLSPVSFKDAGTGRSYGRGLWRIDTYVKACSCWRVKTTRWNAPLS